MSPMTGLQGPVSSQERHTIRGYLQGNDEHVLYVQEKREPFTVMYAHKHRDTGTNYVTRIRLEVIREADPGSVMTLEH